MNTMVVTLGSGDTLFDENGKPVIPPEGWEFLPAGDAGVTRRVKADKQFWVVQTKRGRKIFNKGVWAPAHHILAAKQSMQATRSTDSYKKNLQKSRQRREQKQQLYAGEFYDALILFLNFDALYVVEELQVARAVCDHAVPVGSGTVARTETIPIKERAERAVIAWMRHQTTVYDSMKIPRVKGKRREVRRMLAIKSREILARYRSGEEIPGHCPLLQACRDL